MKRVIAVSVVLAIAPVARGADIDAGREKATTVCAACHGATGISVADTIPNLAGQRARYLETQLKALSDGTRKNPIMNAIASQLSPADIANVAAYFSSQPGAGPGAKSKLLPNVAKTRVAFPDDYKSTFTKYHTINFPKTKQVRYYFANQAAVQAAKSGQPLPEGSVLFVEVHAAKLDSNKKPVTGDDGFFVPAKLLFYTAMAREAGWGKDIPEMLRNGDWNYAVFTTQKKYRPGTNQATCLACHEPLDNVSYTFTLKQIAEAK